MGKKISNIYPVILAAGPWRHAGFTEAEALAARKIGLLRAIENCAGLAPPIVVLGCAAAALRGELASRARTVVNGKWRAGQLSSLMAGLRCVPRDAAFLLYPANLFFLKPRLIERMAAAFLRRARHQQILMPRFQGRAGHPVIFSATLRGELEQARTAREVVYREAGRKFYLAAGTDAIWRDLQTPVELARLRAPGFRN